jgi:hypothetical protein
MINLTLVMRVLFREKKGKKSNGKPLFYYYFPDGKSMEMEKMMGKGRKICSFVCLVVFFGEVLDYF